RLLPYTTLFRSDFIFCLSIDLFGNIYFINCSAGTYCLDKWVLPYNIFIAHRSSPHLHHVFRSLLMHNVLTLLGDLLCCLNNDNLLRLRRLWHIYNLQWLYFSERNGFLHCAPGGRLLFLLSLVNLYGATV